MTALLPLLVALPLAAVPLPVLFGRAGRDPAPPALAAALGTLVLALLVLTGGPALASWPWVPMLGLRFALRADRGAAVIAVAVAAGAVLTLAVACRNGRRRTPAGCCGGVLALTGGLLGAALADDLVLLWCALEVAAGASAWLLGADRADARGRRAALVAVAVTEAGGLALLAAALLVAYVAGSFGLGAALRAAAELRAHPLYLPMVGLALAATTTRLAPWLLPAAGGGAWFARGAALAAAGLLPLRLGPALGGTRGWLGLLAASVAATAGLIAWRAWRDARPAPGPEARSGAGSFLDELAVAARFLWQPLAVPRLGVSLAVLAGGTALAVALGANGARVGTWPGPATLAWPVVAGSGWLLLAVAAGLVRARSRRAAQTLAWAAAGALLLLAAAAPPAIAGAALAAGLLALWPFAHALALPRPSRRAWLALGAAVIAAAALRLAATGLPAPPAAAAATGSARGDLAVLGPIALPLLTMLVLFALGSTRATLRRTLAGGALAANLALSAWLLARADRGAPIRVALGAGSAPFGIELLLDRLAAELLLVAAVLAALAFVHRLANPAVPRGRHADALDQLPLLGVAGSVLAANLLGLVLGFEVLLLALHLRHAPGDAEQRGAAAHVAVIGASGTALMLIAAGCLYATLGTLGFAELAVRVPAVGTDDSPLLRVGAYLLLVVLALRAAALPLGWWLSRAMAATPATAVVSLVMLAETGVYALARLYVLVFPCFAAGPCGPSGLVLPLGLATVAAGGLGALAAAELRGLAAPLLFVATGTLLVGVGSYRVAGLAAAFFLLGPTALAAAALCFAVEGAGRGRRAVVLAALAAMLGLPPFPGWLGRIAILGAAVADALVVWTVVLTTALLTVVAAARMARLPGPASGPVPVGRLVAAGGALALLAALSLAAGPAFDLAARTAREVFDRRAYVAAFPGADAGVPAG